MRVKDGCDTREAGKLKAVLFDLDGTLLPMDQDVFTGAYFQRLAEKLKPYGYEARTLIDSVWAGTAAMVKNDGSRTNEEAFWKRFSELLGTQVLQDMPVFEEYYRVEFQEAEAVCGKNPLAKDCVELIRQKGLRLVLATNPIFPRVATESRIRWAGLSPEEFELYTTYEDFHYSKPNPKYYEELLERQGLSAEDCLMVGNDVEEDMVAQTLGMSVFLLTDCLINRQGRDISSYPHGGFEQLMRWIAEHC